MRRPPPISTLFPYPTLFRSRNSSTNFDIFYDTRHNGVWAGNTPLVYAATDTSNSVQQYPGIAHDEFGAAYVAWTDERLPASVRSEEPQPELQSPCKFVVRLL